MTSAPGAPELREGQSLSGLLLAGPGEIWVNAEEARQWPGRTRFTIGHELGHWVMHREPGQQSLFCRHAEVDEEDGESEHDRAAEIEREANAFAAALHHAGPPDPRSTTSAGATSPTATPASASSSTRQERRWVTDFMR